MWHGRLAWHMAVWYSSSWVIVQLLNYDILESLNERSYIVNNNVPAPVVSYYNQIYCIQFPFDRMPRKPHPATLLPPILARRRLMGASLAFSTFFAMQTATGGAKLPVLIHSRFAALISR